MSKLFLAVAIFVSIMLPSSGLAQERVEKSLDGVSVTLPADEADLADELLKLAKAWQDGMRRDDKSTVPNVLRAYLLSPKAVENSLRHIAQFTGSEDGSDEAMRRDWEEATQLALRSVDAWEAWQRGFDTIHFWTKAEAAEVAKVQRNRWLFQDTEMEIRGDGAGVRLRTSFLPDPIDLEALPDDPSKVAPQRLDLVLAYDLGMTPRAIARQYNDLVNGMLTDPEKGVMVRPAAELYDAIFRRVFERALQRVVVTDEQGEHFRKALSLRVLAAINDNYNPKRGRKILFGLQIRGVASQEWQESIEDLGKRMRNTPPWPTEKDGPAERAVREVALAMVFMSLKNGGDSLDSWIRMQEKPLDAEAFSIRLDEAVGDSGWEEVFRGHCGKLADQFVGAFANQEGAAGDVSLSSMEEDWPRVISGRVEVVHPPGLSEIAKLSAEKVDANLTEIASENDARVPPAFVEKHGAILKSYGLHFREQTAQGWSEIYRLLASGSVPKLRLRFWFIDDAQAAMRDGRLVPGMESDPATGDVEVTASLGWMTAFGAKIAGGEDQESGEISNIIVPISRNQAAELSPDYLSSAIAKKCRVDLDDMIQAAQTGEGLEERFFVLASLLAGEALGRDVIASEDREWFMVGLFNWLAIRITDAEFGEGAGRRVFEKRWPSAKNEPNREQVDLIKWPTSENRDPSPYEATHMYFATRAIEAAFENKDADFVKRFIEEIRKTPRKRTNMETVYRAFKKVGGGDLKKHAQQAGAVGGGFKP